MPEALQDKVVPAEDGRIVVTFQGQSHTLTVNHRPLVKFYPGWNPFALHVSLLPLPLLRLRHERGTEAFWFFDPSFNYRASRFAALAPEEREAVVEALAPFFKALVTSALEALRPTTLQLTEKVRNLGRVLCEELVDVWLERFPPPGCFTPQMLPQDGLSFRAGSPPLKATAFLQLLSVARGLTAKTSPVILSPYGGAILRGFPLLRLPDMELTRFADPAANIVLYIGTVKPSAGAEIAVIYCPQQDLILMEEDTDLARLIPLRLLSLFIGNPDAVEMAPRELTVDFGKAGLSGAFALGAASSLPTSVPSLPGDWPNRPNRT
ncbi:hypothetical protein [Acetobacter sp.]|jgi:hypothetical protein|uniref:hypothetical protein n=1 Tax=Acetobacter sp. TaxID=440 RepID=UPI0025C215D8|nr:hypothetical protein [Acetobacter sp.]MCH4092451.1 hypothetical protein [Acetobacter sp.]MCI1299585.1 hypothetical protein [Acetobacter sp.]MCI1315535.1 hypothetical protein [Acetobacter sp.]